jgi:hypothetical protein
MGLLLQGTGFGEMVTCSLPPDGAGAGAGLGSVDGVDDGAVGVDSTLPQVDVAMAAVARNTVNSQIRGTLDEVFTMTLPQRQILFTPSRGASRPTQKADPNGRAAQPSNPRRRSGECQVSRYQQVGSFDR